MDQSHLDIEEHLGQILKDYGQFMNCELRRYNLSRYGLDPEDILQDVRIRIWQVICEKKKIFTLSAYIKKIISSAVIDQLRKRRREEGLVHQAQQIHVSEQKSIYSWDTIQKRALEETVGRAVEKLISSRRQVVKLYLLGFTIPEIAGYLNWTHDKTRNLLYRGLADLKESLKETETEHGYRP